MNDRTFALPKWGTHILDILLEADGGVVAGDSLQQLAKRFGVPLKFLPRAVASVTRLGIVTADLRRPVMFVAIHRDRLARRKIGLHRPRRRLPNGLRESLKAQSGYRCACCGDPFDSRKLVLDHLIPLSLMGADAPENLVVMLKAHNANKWDRFVRGNLRFYRLERVRAPFGVRFIDGAFWPHINGKVRYSQPEVGDCFETSSHLRLGSARLVD